MNTEYWLPGITIEASRARQPVKSHPHPPQKLTLLGGLNGILIYFILFLFNLGLQKVVFINFVKDVKKNLSPIFQQRR